MPSGNSNFSSAPTGAADDAARRAIEREILRQRGGHPESATGQEVDDA
jgi:hypothetical protein